ncbi:hypothetical protein HJC23_005120 [Cyclotella cryptica]|uniref:BD-FAE-like domain-containing protein n=1 Tax=Cyclotella cryptica TaxID=29204 RepID=A0ABD3QHF8_9STRA|eukprot:CCRYP_005810-RA/>CCRYP_005810-RA protein AED:0.14 eAED:0.14 QI:180/1/1/1/1/1/2/868/516
MTQNPPQYADDPSSLPYNLQHSLSTRNNTRPKRILNLLLHIPTFLFRFFRLVTFVVVLSPAFCVFLWHYLTCDRLAVYYGDASCCCDDPPQVKDGAPKSNGVLPPSATNGHDASDNVTNKQPRNCKKCQPFFSRHYLDIYGSRSPSKEKKPVLLFLTGGAYIIGYKMWGTLLARALSPNILVIVPDYRNYPRVTIEGMVDDVDASVDWVLKHVDKYGGDKNRVVLVGQSAGAHLGGLVVVKKVLDRLMRYHWVTCNTDDINGNVRENNVYRSLKTTYKANQLCGFISTSSPHNLVTMRQVFHRHGLSCSVQKSIFGGVEGDDTVNGNDVFEKWSTFHLVKKCQEEYLSLIDRIRKKLLDCSGQSTACPSKDTKEFDLKDWFPRLCVIHGTNDKTVPVEESIVFLSLLSTIKIPCESKFYNGWTHTDPILEAPMRGNHLYHRDVYNLVRLWTCTGNEKTENSSTTQNAHSVKNTNGDKPLEGIRRSATMPDLDEKHPMLQPICPSPLVEIARICNPF